MKQRLRVGLRIPYDLNTYLFMEAEKQGMSKNALILRILWEWIEDKQEVS